MYKQFLAGHFVVRRSNKYFTAVAMDLCLEQTINRSKKSSAGVIGQTRRKSFVTEWEMIYHEVLALTSLYRKITRVQNDNYELQVHHELSANVSESFETQVNDMMVFIEGRENPFGPGANTLRNIVTQVQVEKSFVEDIVNIFENGRNWYENYRKERFISKMVPISTTLHRINLPTFDSQPQSNMSLPAMSATKKTKSSGEKVVSLANERGYPLDKLLCYEIVDNQFLFDTHSFEYFYGIWF